VKFILPNQSACLDCQAELFTKGTVYQMCTLAERPRQPEHAIAWVKLIHWDQVRKGEEVDGDNEEHIQWIYERAIKRAAEFNIEGVTVSLTKGVVKNIIPAIAASQAVVASTCVTEALKVITDCGPNIDNNIVYNGVRGAHWCNFRFERLPHCSSCGRVLHRIPRVEGETIEQLFQRLDTEFHKPSVSLSANGIPLYLKPAPTTLVNLKKPLAELAPADSMFIATGTEIFEFVWATS
jgi:ubiquitin-activating enzyme E1 C